jgi:hypothetical protein
MRFGNSTVYCINISIEHLSIRYQKFVASDPINSVHLEPKQRWSDLVTAILAFHCSPSWLVRWTMAAAK